jgi:L-seryl-tRNA(Ser) seleniumtransferase
VHAVLDEVSGQAFARGVTREVLVEAVRAAIAAARAAGSEPEGGWGPAVERALHAPGAASLRRVINATGVVLHTNLGRAPLPEAARRAVLDCLGYSTLELDVESGERGSRQDHCRELLADLTGAEAALVTVNAASAVLLVLAALAEGGETIVSRGELVEIGGAFRIPDILAKSGSALVEVGTTNRTRLEDYERAVSPRTRLVLKVHRSNFRLHGFVEDTAVEALVELGRARGIPVAHDVGSGLLIPLDEFGLTGEPVVKDSVATGAVTVFSGDKLLGGPQAGIIVGPAVLLDPMRANPIARAVRPDKITLAALEATLRLYRHPRTALALIPTLAMLTASPESLKRRARRLARRLRPATVVPGTSAVGGGAFPGRELATTLVAVTTPDAEALLSSLRRHDPPVLARTEGGRVVLDVRTIADDEFGVVGDAVAAAREQGGR